MSVSVHELHRLTAAAIARHRELHQHHKHVAHGVAAQRAATAAAGLKPDGTPLSGTAGGTPQSRPPGDGRA